jgi:flagellar hook-associated protein 1
VPLVVGGLAATMSVLGQPDGSHQLRVEFARETFTLGSQPMSGQLGALEDYEARVLVPKLGVVRELAQEIAGKVNAQLGAGFTLDGSPGVDLFEVDVSSSGLLKVRAGLTGPELAFSSDPAAPGDSANLLALIDLKNQPVAAGVLGNVRLGDVHTQLVGRLAMESQQNQASLVTARTVRNQAEESWKSTSGVNTDEEAMNLIQYQQMYQANMKVIAVANQLFDSTLAAMG